MTRRAHAKPFDSEKRLVLLPRLISSRPCDLQSSWFDMLRTFAKESSYPLFQGMGVMQLVCFKMVSSVSTIEGQLSVAVRLLTSVFKADYIVMVHGDMPVQRPKKATSNELRSRERYSGAVDMA